MIIIRWRAAVIALSVMLFSALSHAQEQDALPSYTATGPHIQVSLLANKTALVPGTEVLLGVLFEPEQDWHTYWRNPGDSGEAPTISWQTDAPLAFGDIQWPLPTAIEVAHLVNYGYEGANLLMVPVSIPDDLATTDALQISADISWLVCKEDCIPGWATLVIDIPVSPNGADTPQAGLFEQTKMLLPSEELKSGLFEITENNLVFEVSQLSGQQWTLYPFRSDVIQHAASQQVLSMDDSVQLVIPRSDYFYDQPERLDWLISDGTRGYYVEGHLSSGAAGISASAATDTSLWLFVLMAFAGGLILNLMPCVLPILSIKGMAVQATSQKLSHKLAYLFGVLACFNAFALLIIALQQGGQQIGWGFHMQEPIVVVLLAFLFTFIALILLDAIAVSSRFAGVGNSLVSGESAMSNFSTGALAVIVASPCTAPFMAAALGVAFVSEPPVTLLLFNALALGFALPLTLLFTWSRAISWLPKPGAWMERFKHFLAFPMFATVAWLCWVFAGQMGSQLQFVLLIMLILFCMFIWLLGHATKPVVKVLVSIGLIFSMVFPLWLSVSPNVQGLKGQGASEQSSDYVDFNPQQLATLRNNDEIVVVNMTADWCITCKVNEQVALSSNDVKQALTQENVTYMVGDWTNKNAEIFEYLTQYERAGVPLYVVYAGNKSKQVLPQILTTNTVIDAITKAKQELNHVN
ncbi:thioredoxin family protein [Glaciecola sp. XM2]|uniref:protein-disulfide reductase DsbD family protein n=1 Tax=Glaciecola sp. XM2 TaxID=1914931 RepID=UPI001BDF34EA|nr:protein-disulfide reductase DsbD domain-containing protein [Glaciecola sp. XM2]MBT1452309.1 thioredoxin family protein [Glaciecola sp. XM2]